MTWTIAALSLFGGSLCVLAGAAVLRGCYLAAQLDELIEERKAAREESRRIEARRIARKEEDVLRDAAE